MADLAELRAILSAALLAALTNLSWAECWFLAAGRGLGWCVLVP